MNNGLNLLTLLTIAFVVLKLCHVISWSWWWILLPVWLPPVIGIFALGAAFVCGLIRGAL